MASKKLTKAQAGQLGGFATARKLGSEGMAALGDKGGNALVEKYGREHMIRMAHRSHGRNVKLVTE